MEIEGRRFTGRVRFLYVAPDRIRVDAELPGFFGMMGGSGTVWVDGRQLLWTSSAEPGIHAEREEPVLSAVMGRPPRVDDLKVLVFGLPAFWPRSARPALESELRGPPGRGSVHLQYGDGLSEEGEIGGEPPVLNSLTRRDRAGTMAVAVLDDYRTVGRLRLPGRVTLRSPRTGGRARFRWKRWELDRPDDITRMEWPR
jgi:hypothetical protein